MWDRRGSTQGQRARVNQHPPMQHLTTMSFATLVRYFWNNIAFSTEVQLYAATA
jgi:hypothetical protein